MKRGRANWRERGSWWTVGRLCGLWIRIMRRVGGIVVGWGVGWHWLVRWLEERKGGRMLLGIWPSALLEG